MVNLSQQEKKLINQLNLINERIDELKVMVDKIDCTKRSEKSWYNFNVDTLVLNQKIETRQYTWASTTE